MFSTATTTLLKQIDALIRDLEKKVLGVFEQVVQALETVYSACWEGAGQVQVDPAHLPKLRMRDASSNRVSLTRHVSMTNTTSGIVTPVSATLVDRMIFRTRVGGISKARCCSNRICQT